MTKQTWALAGLVAVLGALCLYQFTDFGRTRLIQINVSSRPFAPQAAPTDALPIIFALDQECKLTRLRVMPLTEVSNAAPQCVWTLQSRKGSEPVRGFAYGDSLPGMQASGTDSARPLVPGTPYRLDVEAEGARGHVDFTPQAAGATP